MCLPSYFRRLRHYLAVSFQSRMRCCCFTISPMICLAAAAPTDRHSRNWRLPGVDWTGCTVRVSDDKPHLHPIRRRIRANSAAEPSKSCPRRQCSPVRLVMRNIPHKHWQVCFSPLSKWQQQFVSTSPQLRLRHVQFLQFGEKCNDM